jgi:alanyl-tRNA synthetase
MTDRLYYTDPYKQAFDATVTRGEIRERGAAIVLDRTAFYPSSGGQPHDLGTLGGARVIDVVDDDSGDVVHIVEVGSGAADPFRPGATVHGVIDWPRRFDHMQQHTGQHVLSAAFDRLLGARTLSFHLGGDASTIDLDRELTPADIAAAEAEANRVVFEDRAVAIRFATADEAASAGLRKPSSREGTIRLVEVADFDRSACGGTHVASTGAIGVIAVGGWERFKGGQRIEFLCGGRALARFRALRDVAAEATRLLSVGRDELPAAVERLLAEIKDHKRTASAAQLELARFKADEIALAAEPAAGGRLVLRAVEGDAAVLKALAAAVTSKPGYGVVLVSTATPAIVVVARSAEPPARMPPSAEVLTALTRTFGGRGGGRPELAQGGGLNGTPEAILEAARAAIAAHP